MRTNPQENQDSSSRKILLRAASFMALGTFSSRFLGMVRDKIVSYYFPVAITDAWYVGFRVPNLLRRIFGEGAMSASFIPIFIGQKHAQGEEPARRTMNVVFSILTLLLLLVSIVGILGADIWLKPLTQGNAFDSIPGKFEMTLRFARLMFFFLFFICIYAFFMAILNALKEFYWPALAPLFFNISCITFALLPTSWVSVSGDLLCYGVLVGGFLQMAVLIPPLQRKGYLPQFTFSWKNTPQALAVFKNMIPGVLSLGLLQVLTLINVHFASQLENGSNSWLYYADRLLELPLSLISVSLGTALLPMLSESFHQGKTTEMSRTLNESLRFSLFLAIPSTFALYFMADEIVSALFLGGKFSLYDVEQTASVVKVYAFALLSYSSIRLMNASFYAMKNLWIPVFASVVSLSLHLMLVSWFMKVWGIQGLTASTALSGFAGFLLLIAFYKWKLGALGWMRILKSMGQYAFLAFLMVGSFSIYSLLVYAFGGGAIARVVNLVLTLIFGGSIYLLFSYLFKLEESHLLWKLIRQKSARNR